MIQYGPSASSDSASNSSAGLPRSQKEICLRFPLKPCIRQLYGPTYDDEVWFLVTPEESNNWNQWMIAYNDAEDEAHPDIWVVYWVVWWWGKYIARPGEGE